MAMNDIQTGQKRNTQTRLFNRGFLIWQDILVSVCVQDRSDFSGPYILKDVFTFLVSCDNLRGAGWKVHLTEFLFKSHL